MSEVTLEEQQIAFDALLEEVGKDVEKTHRDVKEIDILIKQTAAEVERLTQSYQQTTNYVRQLNTNFDTLPREDIREAYMTLNATQQKMLTMRGQLEKLQSDQRNLERTAALQRRLLEITSGQPVMLPTEKPRRMDLDNSNIVRVIQTEEAARQSLVRKMHDGPASSLSNFILQAEICQRYFDVDSERARIELNSLKSTAAATFNQVKNFIFDLRPMMLDDLGVVPTLRRYVETLQENNVTVPITVTGVERRLESHIEVTIFRGVQELLTNALDHAEATQYQVLVDMGPERISAVVEDNGIGFDPDEVYRSNQPYIGLSSLRERIEMLGGELKINSRLGQGTRADFQIPLDQ